MSLTGYSATPPATVPGWRPSTPSTVSPPLDPPITAVRAGSPQPESWA